MAYAKTQEEAIERVKLKRQLRSMGMKNKFKNNDKTADLKKLLRKANLNLRKELNWKEDVGF